MIPVKRLEDTHAELDPDVQEDLANLHNCCPLDEVTVVAAMTMALLGYSS